MCGSAAPCSALWTEVIIISRPHSRLPAETKFQWTAKFFQLPLVLVFLCRRRGLGLRGLAASLLDVELDKSWRLSCSDWEANELSQQQVDGRHTQQQQEIMNKHLTTVEPL